jgi:hypothetical protein
VDLKGNDINGRLWELDQPWWGKARQTGKWERGQSLLEE